MTKWIVGCDHAALDLKNKVKAALEQKGLDVKDVGVFSDAPSNYALIADTFCEHFLKEENAKGVLLCGSGIGISIRANRYRHVRAALVHDTATAELSRKHNDANVLCMGSRTIPQDVAMACLERFLTSEFEGGRHTERVQALDAPLKIQHEG